MGIHGALNLPLPRSQPRTLDRDACPKCGGTGKCQNDYPKPGTGLTMMGKPEPLCEGSGKCYYCGGTGSYFAYVENLGKSLDLVA